ncbi:hypothetical protein ACJJI5_12375 [Microbulbifer sp. EKSA008]|uniref:hypothetical protein n=1 Tax=Microbulbifer sp. EKSA008 TaxID=3243367 RepID=UPI00404319B2
MSGSHGDKPIFLKANSTVNVQSPGDFIFLRSADYPVRVVLNGDSVTMDPGEKRRLDRELDNPELPAFSEFEVQNTTNIDQLVTFVVGVGDYEKVIVSGEMNISPYVNTVFGTSATLPAEFTKTIMLENDEYWFADPDNPYYQDNTTVTNECPDIRGAYFHGINCYVLTHAGLARYELGEGLQKTPDAALTVPTEIIPWRNADGTILELEHNDDETWHNHSYRVLHGLHIAANGTLWFSYNGKICKSHLASMVVEVYSTFIFNPEDGNKTPFSSASELLFDIALGYSNGEYHGIMPNNEQWYSTGPGDSGPDQGADHDKYLVSFNPHTRKVRHRNIGKLATHTNGEGYTKYGFIDDVGHAVIRVQNGDSDYNYFVIDTNLGIEINDEHYSWQYSPHGTVNASFFVPSNNGYYRCVFYGSEVRITTNFMGGIYGLISIKDPGADDSTKLYYYPKERILAIPYKSGNLIYGNIIKMFLGAMLQKTPPGNYLDYVTKLINDTGRIKVTYDTGTNSFYKKGIGDDKVSFLNGDYTLAILPELFG